MPDPTPQFEISDIIGSTAVFRGSAGTSFGDITTSGQIAEILVDVPVAENPSSNRYLDVSFDNGTTFFRVYRGIPFNWNLRSSGNKISIRGSHSGVNYQLVLNSEP